MYVLGMYVYIYVCMCVCMYVCMCVCMCVCVCVCVYVCMYVCTYYAPTSCNTHSSAPEYGQNNCPKHVELTGIINKPLLLHLVVCLYYLYQ